MKTKTIALLLFVFVCISAHSQNQQNIYSFTVENITGKQISLSQYEGKVLLIVNTASKCGLTKQYEGLQTLYNKYKHLGLEILAFPCNQFLGQEPGTAEEILTFCTNNYQVTFPIFAKTDVNGDNTFPMYKYLKEALPIEGKNKIRWNFEKFLINRQGVPYKRFAPRTLPSELVLDIEKLLDMK